MSRIIQKPQSVPPPNPRDFTSLAAQLQQTAQALLHGLQTGTSDVGDADACPTVSGKRPPEYRTYRIPGHMVAEERKLLAMYQADSWQEMFNKAYDQLYTMALLMRHFKTEEELDGYSVQLLGETLMVPLRLFDRLCALVADFRLQTEDEQ